MSIVLLVLLAVGVAAAAPRARVAFVIPYTEREAYALEQVIRHEWSLFPPFATDGNLRRTQGNAVDLVFYYHRSSDKLSDHARGVLIESLGVSQNSSGASGFQRWFGGRVHFVFADLSEAEDSRYLSGANEMFLRLVCSRRNSTLHEWVAERYSHFFYMEVDTHVVRAGWAARAAQIVRAPEPFWINGAVYTGPKILQQWYAGHINGNAFYSTERDFTHRVCQVYEKSPHEATDNGYDVSLYTLMFSHKNHGVGDRLAHRYRYTQFVVNLSHERITRAEAVESYPLAYLVHTKEFAH